MILILEKFHGKEGFQFQRTIKSITSREIIFNINKERTFFNFVIYQYTNSFLKI